MLQTLDIRNLALIEALTLDFHPGLNIVTGETGAGKSILIGALQLLLGERADKGLIRAGAKSCDLHVVLDLRRRPDLLPLINARLAAAGVPPCEDGQLVGSRTLTETASRCFVNMRPVTLQLLRDLGDLLVDVHGAYENQSLLRPARQLDVLDAYAGDPAPLAACAAAYAQWRARQDELAAALAADAIPDLADLLRLQLQEIEPAGLRPGEDAELTARHQLAANAHGIGQTLTAALDRLADGEPAIIDQLGDLLRSLASLERLDPAAGGRFGQTLTGTVSELQELVADLRHYLQNVELNPAELARLDERLGLVNRLKRKYGGSVETVLAHAATCRQRLAKLENSAALRAELAARVQAAADTLQAAAATLTAARREHAAKLAPRVTRKLKALGFPDCQFRIELTPAAPGPRGADAVEFFFAPNPGEGSRPLRDIASSGELSRLMLALKSELATADRLPLLVFDEVDANIGGLVAKRVGEELAAISSSHQVICITHQPSVAAGGDRHFRVSKHVEQQRTVAAVTVLDRPARVAELARMLGGEAADRVVRRHAEELLTRAGGTPPATKRRRPEPPQT